MRTTFSGGTDGESDGDGGEPALVNRVHEIRDLGGPNRGSAQDIAEANVLKITDKFAGGVRKSKGVSPEEPLERYQRCCSDREPNE